MIVQPQASLRDMLDFLMTATTGYFDAVVCRLFSNNIQPSPTTPLADFVECTFDGYAASAALVWNPALTNTSGAAENNAQLLQFTVTGNTVQEFAYGYYITNAAGDALFWSEAFDDPISVAAVGDGVTMVPRYVNQNILVQ